MTEIEQLNARLAAQLAEAQEKLASIQRSVDADEADMAKMRDGTKLTRSGLVEVIAYLKEQLAEARERRSETIAMVAQLESDLTAARENSARLTSELTAKDNLCGDLAQQRDALRAEVARLRTALEKARRDANNNSDAE